MTTMYDHKPVNSDDHDDHAFQDGLVAVLDVLTEVGPAKDVVLAVPGFPPDTGRDFNGVMI